MTVLGMHILCICKYEIPVFLFENIVIKIPLKLKILKVWLSKRSNTYVGTKPLWNQNILYGYCVCEYAQHSLSFVWFKHITLTCIEGLILRHSHIWWHAFYHGCYFTLVLITKTRNKRSVTATSHWPSLIWTSINLCTASILLQGWPSVHSVSRGVENSCVRDLGLVGNTLMLMLLYVCYVEG